MASPTESDMADADLRRKLKQLVQQAFALPGVQQELLAQETAQLIEQIERWLVATIAEEEKQRG